MIVLSCNNISKSYIVEKILDDVTFSINSGDKVGLVGLNGAGKSTLFNIIAGELSADSGTVNIPKNHRVAMLEQQLFSDESNTIYDELLNVFQYLENMESEMRNLEVEISKQSDNYKTKEFDNLMNKYSSLSEKFQSNNGYGYKSEVRGVLKGLGFSEAEFDKRISELSGGQKARVSLGKILLESPEILLLDEPTNHLDIEAIDWLEKYIKDYKGTMIVVSHDRYFLDNSVSRILHLENRKAHLYNGNYSEFIKKRKALLDAKKKQYELNQKEISRQENMIKKFQQYNGQRYVKLVQSRQKMLDRMKKVDNPEVSTKKTSMRFEPAIQSGNDVLSFKELSVGYDENSILFSDINSEIYCGDHIGIIGPNGIGKTSLIKSIQGIIKPLSGNITIGHNVNIAYFDQEQSNINEDNIVLDEIWDEYPDLTHTEIRGLLARFLFIGDDIYKEISALSGGEKSRLSLLKLMLSNANLLLMDEPTNHLDIDSKEVLEDALSNYEGTIMVISHDRYFLNKISDKIWELGSDGLNEYLGDYDYYLEKKTRENMKTEDEIQEKTKTQVNAEKKKEREQRKIAQKERKKIKDLEKKIADQESEISALEIQTYDTEIYSDHEKATHLHAEITKRKDDLEKIYDEWLELTDK